MPRLQTRHHNLTVDLVLGERKKLKTALATLTISAWLLVGFTAAMSWTYGGWWAGEGAHHLANGGVVCGLFLTVVCAAFAHGD